MRAVSPRALFGMPVHLTPGPHPGAAHHSVLPAVVRRWCYREPDHGDPSLLLHGPVHEGATFHRRSTLQRDRSRPALTRRWRVGVIDRPDIVIGFRGQRVQAVKGSDAPTPAD